MPCLYSSLKAIGNFTTKLFTGYGKKLNLKLFDKSMRTLEEIKRIIAEHKCSQTKAVAMEEYRRRFDLCLRREKIGGFTS